MAQTIDILIFGGQSNMQGQTEGCPAANIPVEGVFEYRYLTDTLQPLCHPVGEDIDDGLLWQAVEGGGSLVPDCCRAYRQITGRPVVAIHAARGATAMSQWLKGTPRYACALEKIRQGIEKAKTIGTIGKIYYLWLQGESDALNQTACETYKKMLIAYKNDLKQDIGINVFGIIEVGYFCCNVSWVTDRTKEEARICDEAIMCAQEQAVQEDADFVMLTQICKTLSDDPAYINPQAQGHYNNAAMTRIGTEAGTALAWL